MDRKDKSQLVRTQNDRFRKNLLKVDGDVPGRVVLTSGVTMLTMEEAVFGQDAPSILDAVRSFDAFDADNDPYGEHDFGAMDFRGQRVFWKIDYYAADMLSGAQDPTDLENTERVLTVMLAEEY